MNEEARKRERQRIAREALAGRKPVDEAERTGIDYSVLYSFLRGNQKTESLVRRFVDAYQLGEAQLDELLELHGHAPAVEDCERLILKRLDRQPGRVLEVIQRLADSPRVAEYRATYEAAPAPESTRERLARLFQERFAELRAAYQAKGYKTPLQPSFSHGGIFEEESDVEEGLEIWLRALEVENPTKPRPKELP